MKVVVCVKQVPDTAEVGIDPQTKTLMREGVASILNPLDMYAIEGAVGLGKELGAEVIALSMGPPQAEAVVREAIARGCTGGVLLTDPILAGADTWATSYALACAVRRLGQVGAVFCGKQAIDGDTAQVGPGLAAHLGWPQATYVRRIVAAQKRHLIVECLTDSGIETLRVRLPAVLTVLKDLNEPRLPSLITQMKARRCTIESWGAEQLGGSRSFFGLEGSPTRVVKVFAPPPRAAGVTLKGDAREVAEKLVKVFSDAGLL